MNKLKIFGILIGYYESLEDDGLEYRYMGFKPAHELYPALHDKYEDCMLCIDLDKKKARIYFRKDRLVEEKENFDIFKYIQFCHYSAEKINKISSTLFLPKDQKHEKD